MAPHSHTTAVLVHGGYAAHTGWLGVIAALAHDGVRGVPATNRLRGASTDAADVADLVGCIDGPVVLVGHSYGGVVITQGAAALAQVRALVFVAGLAPDTGESVRDLVSSTSRASLPARVLDEPMTAQVPGWRERSSWFVYGGADRVIPPSTLAFQAERAGSRETAVIADGGHSVHISHPAVVARVIIAAIVGSPTDLRGERPADSERKHHD